MQGYPQNGSPARNAGGQSGFVLMCVLWTLALLTIITVGMGHRALLDARAAAYSMDHARAMLMARGAVHRARAALRNKNVRDAYALKEGGTGLGQPWAQPVDMFAEGGYFAMGGEDEYGEEMCMYWIEDEERRISINTDRSIPLLEQCEALSRSDVRKIMRHRKEDDDAQPFHAIEELRYVIDIDDEEWFGSDGETGLRDLITCHGDGRINLNTASREVLECVPELDKSAIDALMAHRAGEDGELGTTDDRSMDSWHEVQDQVGSAGSLEPLQRYCKFDSQLFTITAVATLRQGKVRARCEAVVSRGGTVAFEWREDPIGS